MTVEYYFGIPIRLKAKAQARKGKYGQIYSPTRKHVEELRELIKEIMRQKGYKIIPREKERNIRTDCLVLFRGIAKGDSDRYENTILDAGQGSIYENDWQVCKRGFEIMEKQKEDKILLGVKRYEDKSKS